MGRKHFLASMTISFLHSVQIMARHLGLLITSVRILEVQFFHKSPLQEIMFMLYGKITLKLFFAFSTDNGQTFVLLIISVRILEFLYSQISSRGNNVYVVWLDDTLGNLDIFFAFSTNNGQTFSTPEHLTEDNTGIPLVPRTKNLIRRK